MVTAQGRINDEACMALVSTLTLICNVTLSLCTKRSLICFSSVGPGHVWIQETDSRICSRQQCLIYSPVRGIYCVRADLPLDIINYQHLSALSLCEGHLNQDGDVQSPNRIQFWWPRIITTGNKHCNKKKDIATLN